MKEIKVEEMLKFGRWDVCPRNLNKGITEPGSENCRRCINFIEKDFVDFGNEGRYITTCNYKN